MVWQLPAKQLVLLIGYVVRFHCFPQFGYVPNVGIGVGLQNLFNISSILIIASMEDSMQWCISGLENHAIYLDEGSIPLSSAFL